MEALPSDSIVITNGMWHNDSPGCELHEGHYCHAWLTEDILCFLCEPGILIGPIVSVEINYTANDTR